MWENRVSIQKSQHYFSNKVPLNKNTEVIKKKNTMGSMVQKPQTSIACIHCSLHTERTVERTVSTRHIGGKWTFSSCQPWPGGCCPIPPAKPLELADFNWNLLIDTPIQNIPKVLERWIRKWEDPPVQGRSYMSWKCAGGQYLVGRSDDWV